MLSAEQRVFAAKFAVVRTAQRSRPLHEHDQTQTRNGVSVDKSTSNVQNSRGELRL